MGRVMSVEVGMESEVGEKEKDGDGDGVREEWEVGPSRERRILTTQMQ